MGPTKYAKECRIDAASLAPEEWFLRTVDGNLILVGGRPRGTLYAVYHLLEDVVGVRWWTPWEEHVPSHRTLRIPALEGHGEPVFSQRCLDTTSHLMRSEPGAHLYAVRNRINADLILSIPFEYGGENDFGPPYMCHVEGQYHAAWRRDGTFKKHPDWISMQNGKREIQSSWTKNQLCLSNPQMRVAFLRKLRGHIRETRDQPVPPMLFDVSLNDVPSLCECAPCQAIVKKYGWEDSGLLLDFVNYLADGIRDEYPGVIIETLAYLNTEPVPKGIKPRPNVAIRLCDTKSSYTAPISRDSHFVKCLRGWSEITDKLMVWDYHTNFGDLAQPMPFEQTFQRDLLLFREYGVTGVMSQFHHPVFEDLRGLRLWLLAKLYEDPYLDQATLIRQFTEGFYGPAASHIRRYIDRLGEAARAKPSNVYTATRMSSCKHLTPAFLHEMQQLFDEAEEAVAGSEVLLRRARHARLAVDKATVARFPQIWNQWKADGKKPEDLPLNRERIGARLRDTAETQWRLRCGTKKKNTIARGWRLATFTDQVDKYLKQSLVTITPPARFARLGKLAYTPFPPDEYGVYALENTEVLEDRESETGIAIRVNMDEKLLGDLGNHVLKWDMHDTRRKATGKEATIRHIAATDVPGRGYHWYKLGTYRITEFNFLWLYGVALSVNVAEAVDVFDRDAEHDVWACVKFDGPAFPHGRKDAKNVISIAWIAAVKADADRAE